MKRIVALLILVFAFTAACTEVCDHGVVEVGNNDDLYEYLAGTWYDEDSNEEVRFSLSGTFYDKYCTTKMSDEIEGRYEADKEGLRLTYSYEFMGQQQFADWKLSEIEDLSFVMTSDIAGSITMERVVECRSLEVGQSCFLDYFDQNTSNSLIYMESQSRIVSIDEDTQKITACGEKGTAYIRLHTNRGEAWAKVVVGDECLDLWYDYVSFIGKDYRYMTSILGSPSINGEDGYSFGYLLRMHNLVSEVDIFMNTSTGLIEDIGIVLIDGAPAAQIQAYIDAHYYPLTDVGNGEFYVTSPSLSQSIAVVRYDKSNNIVWIHDASLIDNK